MLYSHISSYIAKLSVPTCKFLKMPAKIVPPVVRKESIPDKANIGPITVMSGFMTKKTRSLNRWKHRWWQLLDNGYLFYFKSDDRLKLLGQIDIARTCYDVRHGSDKCQVTFPRAAPTCCCISFAVLKRTYYVYTPTAAEAQKWFHALTSMSRVINRKIVAGVERRRAPEPPAPSRPYSPNYRLKITRVATNKGTGVFDSCEDLSRIEYIPIQPKGTNLKSARFMAASVPDYLNKIADDSVSLNEDDTNLDSRLWLDGSPPLSTSVHPVNSAPMMESSKTTSPKVKKQFSAPNNIKKTPVSLLTHCSSLPNSFQEDPENQNGPLKQNFGGLPPRAHSLTTSLICIASATSAEIKPQISSREKLSSSMNPLPTPRPRNGTQPPDPLPTTKPVPKPRKGKAMVKNMKKVSSVPILRLETEQTASIGVSSSPSASPSHNSRSARKNTEPLMNKKLSPPSSPAPPPPTAMQSKESGTSGKKKYLRPSSFPLPPSPSANQKKAGGSPRRKKKSLPPMMFSPPSTPPPPPRIRCDSEPATRKNQRRCSPPSSPAPPPCPRRDTGPPPSFVPTLPKVTSYRNSGPPNFIPPSPPAIED